MWSLFKRKKWIVSKHIKLKDINEFYFTLASSTNPSAFLRYHFYLSEGRYWLLVDKREGDHWPLTEDDRCSFKITNISDDNWNQMLALLENGVVTKRKEDTTTGSSGPWMYLYYNGDKSENQQFEFVAVERQKEFVLLCEKLIKE